jgi:hypothetical protein
MCSRRMLNQGIGKDPYEDTRIGLRSGISTLELWIWQKA